VLTPSYKDLESQIRESFKFGLEKNFVIRYVDDEGDSIIISSNPELVCATQVFGDKVLRLTITLIDSNGGIQQSFEEKKKRHN